MKIWYSIIPVVIFWFLNEYERYFCVVKKTEHEIEKIKKDHENEIKR